MFNPFVGNLLMDAFTTEIGGEVYLRKGPWMAMGGMFAGETRGQVTAPDKRSPAYLGKVGFDKEWSTNVRFRLTSSLFSQASAANQSLYTGDRGGSRYYQVMVNTAGTEKDSAWTGNVQPGYKSAQHAWVVNPFLKLGGVELRANIEQISGKNVGETESRDWNQNAGEALYRFLGNKLYVGEPVQRRERDAAWHDERGHGGPHPGLRRLVHRPDGPVQDRVDAAECTRTSRRPTFATAGRSRASWWRAWSPSDASHHELGLWGGRYRPPHSALTDDRTPMIPYPPPMTRPEIWNVMASCRSWVMGHWCSVISCGTGSSRR